MTLNEVVISALILALVIGAATALYLFGSRAWVQGTELSEELQNARVVTDKISRELRQANEVALIASNQFMIEDGHTERLQYIKYFISPDNTLKRQQIVYLLEGNLTRFDMPQATETIELEQIVSRDINVLSLIPNEGSYIELSFNTKNKTYSTAIYPRN